MIHEFLELLKSLEEPTWKNKRFSNRLKSSYVYPYTTTTFTRAFIQHVSYTWKLLHSSSYTEQSAELSFMGFLKRWSHWMKLLQKTSVSQMEEKLLMSILRNWMQSGELSFNLSITLENNCTREAKLNDHWKKLFERTCVFLYFKDYALTNNYLPKWHFLYLMELSCNYPSVICICLLFNYRVCSGFQQLEETVSGKNRTVEKVPIVFL